MAVVEDRLDRIETLLSDLILTVGTLKSYFEEDREENRKRFEQIDHRFEQIDHRFEQIDHRFEQIDLRFEQLETRMDRRFDEVMLELGNNKREHEYMASRLFRAEMELAQLREQIDSNEREN